MNLRKIAGIVLIAAGIVVLAMRGFNYTKKHKTEVGPFDLSVNEQKRVEIPVWVGIAAAAVGVALLVLPLKTSRGE